MFPRRELLPRLLCVTDDAVLLLCCPDSLGWPQDVEVPFRSGDKKVTNALLELLHDLFCLGLLKMKLEVRSRHEKIKVLFYKGRGKKSIFILARYLCWGIFNIQDSYKDLFYNSVGWCLACPMRLSTKE